MRTIEEFNAAILVAAVLPIKCQQSFANLLDSHWRCLTRSLSTRLTNPFGSHFRSTSQTALTSLPQSI